MILTGILVAIAGLFALAWLRRILRAEIVDLSEAEKRLHGIYEEEAK